jgi:hypothetical protein
MSNQPEFWREQYSHIIDIFNKELDRFWVRFNVGLAINSALIGILAYTFNISQTKTGLLVLSAVSILGIVLSSVWIITVFLSRELQIHYRKLAVRLEDDHITKSDVRIFPDQKQKLGILERLRIRKNSDIGNMGTQNVTYVSYVITWGFWVIWIVFAAYSFRVFGIV